ncbi:MAG TPA: hypothetical protein VNW98_06970, partial [Burkholderiaceae bacterium]|nr:hypothetical protein [Burkholderiaceae bacterium]
DPEHAALKGATFERSAPAGGLQQARSDLEQATQALLAAQARAAQFEGDRMLARPAVWVLNPARDSVSGPMADTLLWLYALAALSGLIAGWALRVVLAADHPVRKAGLKYMSPIIWPDDCGAQ